MNKIKNKLKKSSEKVWHFLRVKIWQQDLHSLSYLQKKVYGILRVLSHVKRGIARNDAILQAGSLTYLTLLALIPILALMFSVSKGLDVHETLVENLGLQSISAEQIEDNNSRSNVLKAK